MKHLTWPAFSSISLLRLWSRVRQHGAIALVLLSFAALGTHYAIATPIFETPGEPWHYLRVEDQLGQRPSPALVELRAARKASPETQQPPLYYALAALLVRSVDISTDDTGYALNPWAAVGDPYTTSNWAAVMRIPPLRLPYWGVAAAVVRLRLLGVFMACLALLAMYATIRALLSSRRDAAVGAAVIVALTPGFVFAVASAGNTAATILAVSVALWGATMAARRPRSFAWAVVLGLACGLSVLLGQDGLPAPLLIPAAYGLGLMRDAAKGRRSFVWRQPLASFVACASLCGPWLAQVYSRQTAHPKADYQLAFAVPIDQPFARPLDVVGSYWATFGWHNVRPDPWFLAVVAALGLAAVGGTLLLALQTSWSRRSRPTGDRGPLVLVVLWLVAVTAHAALRLGTSGWPHSEDWPARVVPQGARFYPAILPISAALYNGVSAWISPRRASLAPLALVLMLGPLAALAPSQYIAPRYAPPQRLSLSDVPNDAQELGISFGDDIYLLGYTLERDSATIGTSLPVRLYWLTRQRITHDYAFSVFLLGRDGQALGAVRSGGGGGNYSTRLWLPGEVVVSNYLIPIDPSSAAPAAGSLRVSVYPDPTEPPVDATDPSGASAGPAPAIAAVRLVRPYHVAYRPDVSVGVEFDERLLLEGYSLSPLNPVSGEVWEVSLVWRATRRTNENYAVFLHLLDGKGKIISQADQEPVGGDYPTSLWRTGEQVLDVHELPVPLTVPSGAYSLRVGWYLRDTDTRLPLTAQPARDYVELGPVYIDAPEPVRANDGQRAP